MVRNEESLLSIEATFNTSMCISVAVDNFPLCFFVPIIRAAGVESNCIKGMTWKVQWHYFMIELPIIFGGDKSSIQQHIFFSSHWQQIPLYIFPPFHRAVHGEAKCIKDKKHKMLPLIVATNDTMHDMSTITVPTITEIPVEAEIEIRSRALIYEDIKEMYSKGENEPTLYEI